ncbi:uncharacterized protein LOC114157953 isoform X2 [Xiphophorus couchianus]|uniref:uncharacterized protein LOC114157953 isoform X2 n=1 Tax=Xiphophorus couchianus TaxID=32473 RepID=UPI0010171AAC|nr:uncharacterized protein LOC114157953 isoform X2 [Xiphophorus couchianus]
MLLSVLLLLMIISQTESGYYGAVLSYTTKDVQGDRFTVVERFKLSFSSCEETDSWSCSGCTNEIDEIRVEWCLGEFTDTKKLTSADFASYWTGWVVGTWIDNRNDASNVQAMMLRELRKRSDINRTNSSPQTSIIPVLRVPSNCQRKIDLLTFDPNGDHVGCRYAVDIQECHTCTPPPVLSLSSSCSLSFSPTSSSDEGSYAVQLVMEDFPSQTIIMTYYDGSTWSISPSSSMSRIPVQFVFKVDPAAPSCTAGEYLPRFLPPTPEHGAQFFINVNETIEINIRAEATQSVITELLFSGPIKMIKSSSGSGYFTLRWRPSAIDDEESHPICFVVQANASSSIYQSEFRCVIVTVGNARLTVLKLKISTTLSLKDNKDEIEKAIKDELIRRGLPPDIKVRLLSHGSVKVNN